MGKEFKIQASRKKITSHTFSLSHDIQMVVQCILLSPWIAHDWAPPHRSTWKWRVESQTFGWADNWSWKRFVRSQQVCRIWRQLFMERSLVPNLLGKIYFHWFWDIWPPPPPEIIKMNWTNRERKNRQQQLNCRYCLAGIHIAFYIYVEIVQNARSLLPHI